MPNLSKAKKKASMPSGVETRGPGRPALKKTKRVPDSPARGPKKRACEQGHHDMLTEQADTEHAKGALLSRQEKVETRRNPQETPQASGLATVATAMRSTLAKEHQSFSGLGTTAMDKRVPSARKTQASSSSVTASIATAMRSTLAKERQSFSGLGTTAMDKRVPSARKTQASSSSVTASIATAMRSTLAKERQSFSGLGTTAMDKRVPSARKTQASSSSVTASKSTRLALARNKRASSGPGTTAMTMHSAMTKKPQSLSGPKTKARATCLAVDKIPATAVATARKTQVPSGLVTRATAASLPLTKNGTTTRQSLSTDMGQPVTETTNVNTGPTREMAQQQPLTIKKKPPGKQLHFSVRLTEGSSRFKDIVVRKQDGFTHIFLCTKSSKDNSLNLEVMNEIQNALNKAAADDSKLVLLGAIGHVFCSGLDFDYFKQRLLVDKKRESIKMAEAIKSFVNTFIQFEKPLIAAVNGPAIGLGASMLPLCDVVWTHEKAWFQTPYVHFGQSPDGCSSFTFPRIMGEASAYEMLLNGQKLTAQAAYEKGLVSQVFWPQTFTQEVMIRIKELASCNALVLTESKALVRFNTKFQLEQANERECTVLKAIWGSADGVNAILRYLEKKIQC